MSELRTQKQKQKKKRGLWLVEPMMERLKMLLLLLKKKVPSWEQQQIQMMPDQW